MKVSYKWLKEYLDLSDVTPDELAEKMSRTGIEVDDVIYPGKGLSKIVVGETLSVVDHPDSDHLHVCQVNVGADEPIQIVCGAPNVAAGQKVIVALHGARITGNAKIKKGKMRGQESNGMICSLAELGYPESVVPKKYADGIFVLPTEAVPGTEVVDLLDLDDAILDIDITPNRADALSMRGSAYEVAAIYNKELEFPAAPVSEKTGSVADHIKVAVEDTTDAPAYHIQVIKDVKIAESPLWLQNKLMNGGIRPINNVVDITNYILLEYGQPLHAFDYDQIGSKEIIVRRAKANEKMTTLDGVERTLDTDNIVITNGTAPIALAGVMGGMDSEITDGTVTVALESALFNPVLIRKTAGKFNLRSESSSRFEKGINVATILTAGQHAAELIHELAGGTIVAGTASVDTVEVKDTEVVITLEKINRSLGTAISSDEVTAIFNQLGFASTFDGETFTVAVPPRRWDISIYADILEEVARIYGYDNLPETLPITPALPTALTPKQHTMRITRRFMEGAGLTQNISYVLTTAEKAREYAVEDKEGIRLAWPMSEDRSTLRMNLLSTLLDNAAYNVARKSTDIQFYEIGRVFFPSADSVLPIEAERLAGVLTGMAYQKDWQMAAEPVNFYHAKGVLDGYFETMGLSDQIRFEAAKDLKWMHPGRTAAVYMGDAYIGYVGQVHPATANAYDLKETYAFEIDFEAIIAAPKEVITQQPIPKFPGVTRDVALLVDETVTHQQIVRTIKENGGKFLKDVHLFDIYQGKGIEDGKKSVAYSMSFLNPEATLVDEDINKAFAKLVAALETECGAAIR
ncbi:phenylalanine--tRNA ligase subunit beta [Trichococcus pasteurii]|uniref:Phenylalanine--tRNA ligase beta subunit n=1 Tax=Trichococcus pasteurii TaxID=43064 RepID=A0A1W1IBH0_9LACT|nr:phenylalanine--tRNA ligase subunit beta [Trichococcus pasteurii]SFE22169.1 phenylalanyl-tRNA synthetase beta subunit [Trichococcus pasteurii]SLM50352.1 phenylalanyl-trna synthetase b3/b4 [Trichococcus pasteurii]SSB91233.1 phenylalanyl-trna synthetase b3/b4 [Trichococcus pasteurii]